MKVSRDVESLACWLHEAYLATKPTPDSVPWERASAGAKNVYRRVARAMLKSPPLPVRKAVRRIECIR